MEQLAIRWLGLPSIELDGKLLSFERRKGVALLAYLSINQTAQSRSGLASLLWPEFERKSALAYLRRSLWSLNQVLPKGMLLIDRQSVALCRCDQIEVDVHQFNKIERLIVSQSGAFSAETLTQIEQATALYRGDFLQGFTLEDSSEFDAWQSQQTEHIRQCLLDAYRVLVNGHVAAGRVDRAAHFAQRWLQMDPLAELAHQTIIKIHLYNGRRKMAVWQFEQYRDLLLQELEIVPSVEMLSLYREAQGGTFHSTQMRLENGFEHRRRVLLPMPSRPFFGRTQAVQQLITELKEPHRRLITMMGWGGVGKSALAQHVAQQVAADFRNGVYFVDLAASQTSLLAVLQRAIGLRVTASAEQMIVQLQRQHCLLLIDGLDMTMDQRWLIAQILNAAPKVKLLITSRERLNLREERVLFLGGLASETESELSPAVRLFLDAAWQMDSYFSADPHILQTIETICHLLDNTPLAIELAAQMIRLYSVDDIIHIITHDLGRLRSPYQNATSHHNSLRVLFDEVWQRLCVLEQQAYRRLAMFEGVFDLETAKSAAKVAPDMLLRLLDKSLLLQSAERQYRFPKIYYPFVQEHLSAVSNQQKQVADRNQKPEIKSETRKLALHHDQLY